MIHHSHIASRVSISGGVISPVSVSTCSLVVSNSRDEHFEQVQRVIDRAGGQVDHGGQRSGRGGSPTALSA